MLRRSTPVLSSRSRSRWLEKLMAAIALFNFTLVLLDYSYIPFRDYYLRIAPNLTQQYGEYFKGIVAHRTTEQYLNTIQQLDRDNLGRGVSDPLLLAGLRQQSGTIIDENPFAAANKTGTLERVKRRMTNYISETTGQDITSAKEAFNIFWSNDYLTPETYEEKLQFFDQDIEPLIATNYYRRVGIPFIGSSGIPVDRFILIDAGFIVLFFLEFLLRTAWLSRRYDNTNWWDAMVWRWYDVFLFLPFWHWLRAIPVTTRINQSGLINLEPIRNRLTRGILASVAVELTEVVVLRVIDQVQNMIREGNIRRTLLDPNTGPRYVDLNGIDEIQLITQRLTNTLLHDVLPKVQPDIEILLQHTILNVLDNNPVYGRLRILPGMTNLSAQLAQQLSTELYTAIYNALTDALADEKGAALTQALVDKIGNTFRAEIQQDEGVEELEALINVWLDEVKINYVQRLADEDIENLREEAQKIYAITRQKGR